VVEEFSGYQIEGLDALLGTTEHDRTLARCNQGGSKPGSIPRSQTSAHEQLRESTAPRSKDARRMLEELT